MSADAVLSAADPIRVVVAARPGAWLEVEEAGAEVVLEGASGDTVEVTVPPRYGRFFVPLSSNSTTLVRRTAISQLRAAVHLALYCNPSLADSERIDWYRRAAAISRTLLPNPVGVPIERTLTEVNALEESSIDANAKALANHLRAQAWFAANRTFESIPAFEAAEAAWRHAGDPSRALAARVGRLEELNRAGRYQEVIQLTKTPIEAIDTDEYFSIRFALPRCLALRDIGRLQEANDCYLNGIAILGAAGEMAETSGITISRANVLRDLGQLKSAQAAAVRAHDMAEGPDAPLLRGRADLLLYDILLDRGLIAEALNRMDGALREFASVHASRWEANALLRAAWMYAQFGASTEATDLIDAAMGRLSESDAPARIAAADTVIAEVRRSTGDIAAAMDAARSAETIYERLGMLRQLATSRILVAELQLDAGDAAAASRSFRNIDTSATLGWGDLCRARIAIAQGRVASARSILHRLSTLSNSLAHRVELAGLRARLLALSGNRTQALIHLRAVAERIRTEASRSSNPLMTELLMRQILALRSVAVEFMSVTEVDPMARLSMSSKERIEEAWRWVWLGQPPEAAYSESAIANSNADRFDQAVAIELLADPYRRERSTSLEGAHSLLASISSNNRHSWAVEERMPDLSHLKTTLAPGAEFMALLDGDSTSIMLWVSKRDARITIVPDRKTIRESKDRLFDLLQTSASSVAEIHAAAASLSSMLLWNITAGNAPKTLLLDANGELSGIPMPVMRWSSAENDLLAGTDVSMVQLSGGCCHTTKSLGVRRLAVAVRSTFPSERQPMLPVAAIEAQAISLVMSRRSNIHVDAVSSPGKDTVFDLLRKDGDWVHFAMHGRAMTDRVGFNGLFLDDAVDSPSSLLTGLDVLGHEIRSNLVVLGTCESAKRGRQGRYTAFSFADAVSRAGAKNVIASLWPLSDSAAAIWVPVFYGKVADGDDVFAHALREAQLRLRVSRSFRHPFYWSSLVHLAHFSIRDDKVDSVYAFRSSQIARSRTER